MIDEREKKEKAELEAIVAEKAAKAKAQQDSEFVMEGSVVERD